MLMDLSGASDIDPNSKGSFVDARHLAVVFAFYGIDPAVDTAYAANPNHFTGPRYEAIYQSIVDEMTVRFAAQVSLAQAFNGSTAEYVAANPFLAFMDISFNQFTDRITVDLDKLMVDLVASAPSGVGVSAYWDKVLPIIKGLHVDLFDYTLSTLAVQFMISAEKAG